MTNNTRIWLHGLGAAFIGGGSAAVSAAFGVNIIDPKDWNVTDHPGHLFELMGACFVLNGAFAAFAYLRQSPLPPVIDTIQTQETEMKIQPIADGSAKVTSTTKTTTTAVPQEPPK